MYKIEKNIPCKKTNYDTYTGVLDNMEVGDSFLIETLSENIKFQSARTSMKPKRFSIKMWEDKYRCWRVE